MVDKIPRSHEIKLVHGSKPISALALDPSGARVISGSVDYDLKFWDFAGMDPSLRSFRKLRPCESHVINHLGERVYNNGFFKSVLWIRIRIHFGRPDPNPRWEYGSGSRRAKITHKSEENSSFEVLDVLF
jgi:hypothetical protein